MKKEIYTAPTMEVYLFESEDVITTSGVEPTSLKNGGTGIPEELSYSELFK